MDVDEILASSGLPEVAVSTEDALSRTVRRGRAQRRRRTRVAGTLALVAAIATGTGALVSTRGGGDPARVQAGPGAVEGDPTNGEPADPMASEPEPGDAAVWTVDPADPPTADGSTFTALVSRLGCNSGVTGRVLRPGVAVDGTTVVVTFNVEHDADGGDCPGNDQVAYEVQLGEPVGDRTLVDGSCIAGGAAGSTSHCTDDDGVRWSSDGTFAIWPETDRVQLSAEEPPWSADPGETALVFARSVLGWDDATVIAVEPRDDGLGGNAQVVESSSRGGSAMLAVAPLAGDRYRVHQVDARDNLDSSASVSVNGRVAFADAGPAPASTSSTTVRFDYGGVVSEGRAGEEIALGDRGSSSGSVLVMFRDAAGEVIGAWGTTLPAGNFAAG